MARDVLKFFSIAMIIGSLLIAQPPLPAAAQDSGSQTTLVVVAWGDTLYSLARLYGTTPQAIADANQIAADSRLYAGQYLVVPVSGQRYYRAVTSNSDEDPIIHIVQPGDTIFKISQAYGVPMEWIIAANNLINPSRIYVGQQLIIPGSLEEAQTGQPSELTPTQHVVQPGEYLSLIAQRYGISTWTLVTYNNLSNPSLLYVGTVLSIPIYTQAGTASPSQDASPDTVQLSPGEAVGLLGTESTPTDPPPAATPAPTAEPAAAEPGSTDGRPSTYIVQRGDILSRIAQRFGVTLSELLAVNNIPNYNRIYVGQTIVIPGPAPAPEPVTTTGKQIVVVLSQQRTYAYENGELVATFLVSTGLPATPTVTGDYAIYLKILSQRMTGPGYDLPNVPWVMYFYQAYSFHGTYWHNNFGQPMSHGCVNMITPEAQWLYEWAPIGTPVRVIP